MAPGAVSAGKQRLAALPARLAAAEGARSAALGQRVDALRRQLGALSPLAVLQRGYGIVRGPDGAILRSPAGLREGDRVTATLAGGGFAALVEGQGGAPAAKRRKGAKPSQAASADRQMSLF